jgi:hypothetical protein
MNEVIAAEAKQDNSLSTPKRGLDIAKVDAIMGREQERDLKMIYRFDQIQAFCDMPEDARRQYHFERKPSDPVLIQSFWEAQRRYKLALSMEQQYLDEASSGGAKDRGKDTPEGLALQYAQLALKWFDKCLAITQDCGEMRTECVDRLFAWKKHAEERGLSMDDKTTEELEQLRDG